MFNLVDTVKQVIETKSDGRVAVIRAYLCGNSGEGFWLQDDSDRISEKRVLISHRDFHQIFEPQFEIAAGGQLDYMFEAIAEGVIEHINSPTGDVALERIARLQVCDAGFFEEVVLDLDKAREVGEKKFYRPSIE
ncbi:MAG: hypothetical protein AAGK09_01465 [Planctomycetota bacterium]